MNPVDRALFDELVDLEIARLPTRLKQLLEESPIIIEDRPSEELLIQLGLDADDETLCGLHTGIPITERSVTDHATLEFIHLFREGIVAAADGLLSGGETVVAAEIRITLLHEIGHHFGLEDDDLDALGYG